MPNYDNFDTLYYTKTVAAAATDEPLLAGVTNHRIVVVQLHALCGATATTLLIESGTTTALTPVWSLGTNGDVTLPYSSRGWFETGVSAGLTATTGAGTPVGILIGYVID